MRKLLKKKESGFSMIELLMAMTIGLIILGAVSSAFILQRQTYSSQEEVAEMVQTARAVMDMMIREIRMAGYDPAAAGITGIPYNANASTIDVFADLDGNGVTTGTYEHITYSYDGSNKRITRNTNSGGGAQPFAENIQAFTVAYRDQNGTATTTSANIREILLTITTQTANPDPDYAENGGYRRYTLTSLITPRNLAL